MIRLTKLLNTLDPSAIALNGDAFFGSDNPVTGWETQDNTDFGVQTALHLHYRTSVTTLPEAYDSSGMIYYYAPSGPQVVDPAHGVTTANANRAAANFDYSYSVGQGGSPETLQDFLANGGHMTLQFDLNPGAGVTWETLHAVYDVTLNPLGSHIVWKDDNGNAVITDDGGNTQVTQNSENYAFFASHIDTNPHLAGIQPYTLGNADFQIHEQVTYDGEIVTDQRYDMLVGNAQPAKAVVQTDASLDASQSDVNGHMFFGSGNLPDHFIKADNDAFNFEDGIKWHYRTSDTTLPQAVESNGVIVNYGTEGTQVVDPAHGVTTANANRAVDNFDFSFSSNHDGSGTETLQNFLSHGGRMDLMIDLDATAKTNYMDLHAVYNPTLNPLGSHIAWLDSHGHAVITDDGGNAFVTQNSENYAFFKSIVDTNPHLHGIQPYDYGAGTFDVVEHVTEHGHLVTNIHSELLIA